MVNFLLAKSPNEIFCMQQCTYVSNKRWNHIEWCFFLFQCIKLLFVMSLSRCGLIYWVIFGLDFLHHFVYYALLLLWWHWPSLDTKFLSLTRNMVKVSSNMWLTHCCRWHGLSLSNWNYIYHLVVSFSCMILVYKFHQTIRLLVVVKDHGNACLLSYFPKTLVLNFYA